MKSEQRKKRMIKGLVLFMALIVGSWAFSGVVSAEPPYKEYTLGASLPLSGPAAQFGKIQAKAALMAVEDINSQGGVNGVPLRLIIEDTKSNPKDGVTAFIKLVDMYKVPYVLSTMSSVCMAQQPIAADRKVLLVNVGAWAPGLANKPYLYNATVLGPYIMKAGSWYLFKELGLRKAAYIGTNDPAGAGVVKEISAMWEKWGGKVVAKEYFQLGATNFVPQLTKIKATKPDVIILPIYGTAVGFLIKQIREMGLKQPLLSLYFIPANYKIAGEASEGLLVNTEYLNLDSDNPKTHEWCLRTTKEFGRAPIYWDANSYDLVVVLENLIKQCEKAGGKFYSGENLKNALEKTPSFPSVFGEDLLFGKNHHAIKSVGLFKIVSGKKTFMRLVEPPEEK